jgi:hypothetical protein
MIATAAEKDTGNKSVFPAVEELRPFPPDSKEINIWRITLKQAGLSKQVDSYLTLAFSTVGSVRKIEKIM